MAWQLMGDVTRALGAYKTRDLHKTLAIGRDRQLYLN